jgi:hypothetical protein
LRELSFSAENSIFSGRAFYQGQIQWRIIGPFPANPKGDHAFDYALNSRVPAPDPRSAKSDIFLK